MKDTTLLEDVGGRPVLERVHKLFYDKLYEHPWFKLFFQDIIQEIIENQQTDFMVSNMGGGKIFSGRLPKAAHMHIYIDAELFDLRTRILEECILECGVPPKLAELWVRIDSAFKHTLIKKSIDHCEKRYTTDKLKIFDKPNDL